MERTIIKSGLFRKGKKGLSNELDLRELLKKELAYLGIPYLDPCCYNIYFYNTCCLYNPIEVEVNSINGLYTFLSQKPNISLLTGPYTNNNIEANSTTTLAEFLAENKYGGQGKLWGVNNCNLSLSIPNNTTSPGNLTGEEYIIYTYRTEVSFATSAVSNYNSYSDSYDLTGFDSVERLEAIGKLHYIKWFDINDLNIFGNDNLFTDTFRKEFQDISVGNRSEIDFIGNTSENAQSWAKNYCNFVNSKINNTNIVGVQYFDPNSEVITSSTGYTSYSYEFYVILPTNYKLNKIVYATYTTVENFVATNWTGIPWTISPLHEAVIDNGVIKTFSIAPEINVDNTKDCKIII